MRWLRRATAVCAALLLLWTTALAENTFFQHAAGWELESMPLQLDASAEVLTHMPFDDVRAEMLKRVLDNLSLRMLLGEDEGSVTVRVGTQDVLTLAYMGQDAQLSCLPDTTYTAASADPLDLLLGASTAVDGIFGLNGTEESWLTDGWTLLNGAVDAFEYYGKKKSVKTTVENMGLARSCTDFSVPKADLDEMKQTLLDLCPEGKLRALIERLTFSGTQKLRVYRTEEGVPLRMEYNGVCGPEGNLRTVKLVWRMRRDDEATRDEITLTSPAKSGKNKNTLNFTRILTEEKPGQMRLEGEFDYTAVLNKETTKVTGDFLLKNDFVANQTDHVTGSVTLTQTLPGADAATGLTFTPDILISGTEMEPEATGTLEIKQKKGKNVTEDVRVSLKLLRSEDSCWQEHPQTVDLEALNEEELLAVQQQVSSSVATALVRPLILLMGDSAQWFFQDLPDDAVQEIIDAAGSILFVE